MPLFPNDSVSPDFEPVHIQPRQLGLAHEPEMLYSLGGPILFTAPHSLNIVRGGRDGERRRIHKREVSVRALANPLSLHIMRLMIEGLGFMTGI